MIDPNTKDWYLIDVKDKVLGRAASQIAKILQGKHKPAYRPNLDVGDYVVVVNAGRVKVTGNKLKNKIYYRHSGYLSGLKKKSLGQLMDQDPTLVIKKAVWGMMPHTKLGRSMFRKLKVYKGSQHPHKERQLKELKIKD